MCARLLASLVVAAALAVAPQPAGEAAAATCQGSVGPGMPPPNVGGGIPGYHAHWYGQSGYPTLCAGERSTAVVAYKNTGTFGWIRGRMGHAAYLGTWNPDPGQDQPSLIGGDGTNGTPNTGWPHYARVAQQPHEWVGPGQVAWFQFTIQAPRTPGYYRLYVRPLIEGTTWMEDFGVFWQVTVLNPDGTMPPPPPPPPAVASNTGYSRLSVPTARGTFTTDLIKERLSSVTIKTVTANANDCFDQCPAKPLHEYVHENGAFAGMNGTYICPPDYAACAGQVNRYDYAVYNSNLRKWINEPFLRSNNALVTFAGRTPRYWSRASLYDRSPVTAGISMFPLLLQNGAVVNSDSQQTAVQQMRAGVKGAIGTDATYVYFVHVWTANLYDMAYVLQALGARDALNLDGGGTAAMHYNGAYRVGPGRLLPNAIVLVRQ